MKIQELNSMENIARLLRITDVMQALKTKLHFNMFNMHYKIISSVVLQSKLYHLQVYYYFLKKFLNHKTAIHYFNVFSMHIKKKSIVYSLLFWSSKNETEI